MNVRRKNRSGRIAVLLVAGLLAAACSNREGDESASTEAPAATEAPVGTEAPAGSEAPAATEAPVGTEAPTGVTFGDLPSPCGPAGDAGVPTIAEGQNGGDVLRLGTATDHGFEARPGLTIEMLDAAEAFAGWCNEQGGIRGLPIEVVDLDGKLFGVPAAMEQACSEVFAMVGGGWVLDDQIFPRYHQCGMINFAGYTVTGTTSLSNGKVQPLPNPVNVKPTSWLIWAKENYPEAVKNFAIIYGNLGSTVSVADQLKLSMEALGGFEVTQMIAYNAGGEANWAPFAQQLKDEGVTAMSFVGEPGNFILLSKAMREIGYVPELVLNDANFYSSELVAEGNTDATEGFFARTAYAPFEEADSNKAMADFLDMMATHNPDGRVAGLGLQATSAYLLFAVAANACLDANDNVLERECVLAEGNKISEWNAGGLHTTSNPGSNLPPECGIIMGVVDGTWKRVFPELGSADDNGGGWHCDSPGRVEIEGDFGDLTLGVDPERPN